MERDLKEALLGRDVVAVNALRGLRAAILEVEVAEGKRGEGLSDAEIEKVVAREVKKRREAIEYYVAGGRGELVEAEEGEMGVLERYLPRQLSREEILEKVDDVLMSLPEATMADMGRVIGEVKAVVGQGAEGAVVARLVKERLGEK
jgi:uncharacterized protein YqeY